MEQRTNVLIGLGVVAAFAALFLLSRCDPKVENRNLFLDEQPPTALSQQSGTRAAWVVRSRIAKLNADYFFGPSFEPNSNESTLFNLFEDIGFNARTTSHEQVGSGTLIWRGKSEDDKVVRIALAISGRNIDGEIRALGFSVRITPIRDGWHLVERIDDTRFPAEADPFEGSVLPSSEAGDPELAKICDAPLEPGSPIPGPGKGVSTIRILFAYTPSAAGQVNPNLFSDLLIDQLTDIWARSSSNFAVIPELAQVVLLKQPESGNSGTDLSRLKAKSDGFWDEIHGIRDSSKADLVTVIVGNMANACGIGYVPYPPNAANSDFGFTVVLRSCALSNLSVAHELGHNLSMNHDRYVAGSTTGRYNYGYSNKTLGVRTIMAYANECAASGLSCQRVPEYSHPYEYMKGGQFIGKPIGTSNAAHNRNMLCTAAIPVSKYR